MEISHAKAGLPAINRHNEPSGFLPLDELIGGGLSKEDDIPDLW